MLLLLCVIAVFFVLFGEHSHLIFLHNISFDLDCVNCVRWSLDGTYLGCAGDQQSLTLWEFGGLVFSAGTIGSEVFFCKLTPSFLHYYFCILPCEQNQNRCQNFHVMKDNSGFCQCRKISGKVPTVWPFVRCATS